MNETEHLIFNGFTPDLPLRDEHENAFAFADDELFDDPVHLFCLYYGLEPHNIPELTTVIGTALEREDAALLFTVHEALAYVPNGWHGRLAMPVWEQPGLCPRAAELVASIDPESLQKALIRVADACLHSEFISKKRSLAFPLCRYADEGTMAELTRRALKWEAHDIFDTAVLYSSTRAAMLYADRVHMLSRYAALRGTDEDALRDGPLSDLGLAPDRTKRYDLGGFFVTLRLGEDFSLSFEPDRGRPAKTLPKRGADPVLYARAKADSECVRRYARPVIRNRIAVLFSDFLSGRERPAEAWKAAYLENPLLLSAAKGLVWEQGGTTFALTDAGPVTASGEAYAVGEAPIRLAHPIELSPELLAEWQRYLTVRGLKQPFEQVWEPVRRPEDLAPDRYAGVPIPFYRFKDQEKRGILFGDRAVPELAGCGEDTELVPHAAADPNGVRCYELRRFTFGEYTRGINHLAAYFDRITLLSRIRADDPAVADLIQGFTAAQLSEFIAAAQEARAVNAAAALLDYKQARFPDLDPLDGFTLEW